MKPSIVSGRSTPSLASMNMPSPSRRWLRDVAAVSVGMMLAFTLFFYPIFSVNVVCHIPLPSDAMDQPQASTNAHSCTRTYTHVAAANAISFLPRRRPTWSHLSQDCIGAGLPFPTDQRVLPATTSSGAISNPSFQMQLSFLPPPLVVCLPSRLCPASRRRHYPCVFLLSTVPGWRRA